MAPPIATRFHGNGRLAALAPAEAAPSAVFAATFVSAFATADVVSAASAVILAAALATFFPVTVSDAAASASSALASISFTCVSRSMISIV